MTESVRHEAADFTTGHGKSEFAINRANGEGLKPLEPAHVLLIGGVELVNVRG